MKIGTDKLAFDPARRHWPCASTMKDLQLRIENLKWAVGQAKARLVMAAMWVTLLGAVLVALVKGEEETNDEGPGVPAIAPEAHEGGDAS